MTPAGEVLAAEIRARRPHRLSADLWRWRSTIPITATTVAPRDPFGKEGDFYTAEQVQPVFGILMAARIRAALPGDGGSRRFHASSNWVRGGERWRTRSAEWRYVPVDMDSGALPGAFTGVVFSNEFFDALPVEVAVYREGAFREQRVALRGEQFAWEERRTRRSRSASDYLRRYFPPPAEGPVVRSQPRGARLDRANLPPRSSAGYLLTIDYGYTRRRGRALSRGDSDGLPPSHGARRRAGRSRASATSPPT